MINVAMRVMLPKGIKILNLTLITQSRSCEEQLTEIRKKYQDKYITFTNNKQLLSDYPFPNVTCLIVDGDSTLAGIDKNRLSTGKHEVKVRYFP